MEKVEIKKALYKEKPNAKFMYVRKGNIHYTTSIASGYEVTFTVPVGDIGDADFLFEMPAQLLNRWID
jgi:hypothetical protein